MASLGGLVAGIAHDVNTPVGVSVTAASFLQDRLKTLKTAFDDKKLTSKTMSSFIEEAEQTTTLLLSNLNRASDLVASFKQVAVDQTSEAERDVDMKEYIREVTQSLAPKFKKTKKTTFISQHPPTNPDQRPLLKCGQGHKSMEDIDIIQSHWLKSGVVQKQNLKSGI